MASTYLSRVSGTPTSTKKFTISFWVKKCGQGADQFLVSSFTDASNRMQVNFNTDDRVDFICKVSGSNVIRKQPNRQLRDPSAFYHVVVAVDTTLGTASDRCKIYINGEQETSFAYETNPSQNADANVSGDHFIGAYDNGGSPSLFFDGVLSHVHFTDGYTYDASTFGSTDATTGEWKINTSPSITMGTNGFTILKDGNTITDQSANSNNFSLGGGTLTNTEDCPSNVFCTWNAINPFGGTLANGNLTVGNSSSYDHNVQGTLGMTSGKYYWEYKMGNSHGEFGVCENGKSPQTDPQNAAGNYFIYNNGSNTTGTVYNNVSGSSSSTVTVTAFASGMICGCAYDADNEALYFHQNGTYVNSGDPTSGANKTGAIITNLRARYGGVIVPFMGFGTSSARTNFHANFGNGFFGTTAISSEGTNASGIGKFEYDVPTGYTALSTKGLNE